MKKHAGTSQLWTRENAKMARRAVETLLDKLQEGDALILDLSGVEVFDFSYANEFFGKLAFSMPANHEGRFLIIEGLTTYTRDNLQNALESLKVPMIERKGKSLRLVGKYHPSDAETFTAIARAKRPVTSSDLVKAFKEVTVNAMNERLNKLTGLGLVRRARVASEAGREQFQYTVLA